MTMTKTILFRLHHNRSMVGSATIVDQDGTILLGPWKCLGCCDSVAADAHGNPSCDPLKPWGDTPTGDYKIVGLLNHGKLEQDIHSYGPFDTLELKGIIGAAATAMKLRDGLEAHAGDPSPTGALRVTHGCLRSSNRDQDAMIEFIKNNGGIANFRVRVAEVF